MFFSMDVRLWCSVHVYFNFVGNFPNWVFNFLSVHSCSSWFFCLFLHTQWTLAIRYSSLSSMDVNSTLFTVFHMAPQKIVCVSTIDILCRFFSLSMHQSECRKCNRVSLHATYRLTFAGHFFSTSFMRLHCESECCFLFGYFNLFFSWPHFFFIHHHTLLLFFVWFFLICRLSVFALRSAVYTMFTFFSYGFFSSFCTSLPFELDFVFSLFWHLIFYDRIFFSSNI